MIRNSASLKERLAGWTSWDLADFHLGACLGFWPEFGAPYDNDPWHGVKDVMHTTKHEPLGAILEWFIKDLVEVGCLEEKVINIEESLKDGRTVIVPTSHYRWNPNYKGPADIISTLE